VRKNNKENNKREKYKMRRQKQYSNRRNVRRLKEYTVEKKKFAPHPLILIKKHTYDKVKDNSIILTNMTRKDVKKFNLSDGGITSFSIKYCGANTYHLLHKMKTQQTTLYNIQGNDIPKDYLLILCNYNEAGLINDPNITYIPREAEEGDYALLLLYVANIHKISNLQHIPIWDNMKLSSHLNKIKKSTIKSNISNHHYGSTGECYSFGVRNAFSKSLSKNVSLTKYAGDENDGSKYYKDYIWNILSMAFNSFDRIITGLSNNLNITCRYMKTQSNKTELVQYFEKDSNTNKDKTLPLILSASININARTRDIHCEKDITYTTIHVPPQTEINGYIVFEFQFSTNLSMKIQVMQNCCFTYSAYCLAHRQIYTNGFKCMNLSTYSTNKVFNSYRKSMMRIHKSNSNESN
jgi:hypothetical protein